MITGVVTASRQVIIRLTVHVPAGQEQEIATVIDTRFDGTLTLPPALITTLGLVWRRRGRALMADGSESLFDIALCSRLRAASCFWRAGQPDQAHGIFESMIQDHPTQEQAIREVIAAK
ncbi:MAG: hypothetical protein ACRERE_45780 [Candidatus Entotheonellia bacterium]